MKKRIRLTESDIHNIIKETIKEVDKMNDMVTNYNRYGRKLPDHYFDNDDPDKPLDWDKPTSWKLREPEIDDADYYGESPQSVQRRKNSHLSFNTGHPINYNSDVWDKIESDSQLLDPKYSSHNFTFDDDNCTFIRPSHWMVNDDEMWKGVNEPAKTNKETFDSADKRFLHRKGSRNRELIDMGAQKKLDEAIRRAIRKVLR